MKNKYILLAGGSGFLGQELTAQWGKDNRVAILTRNIKGAANNIYGEKKQADNAEMIHWDGKTQGGWVQKLEGCDILINLAGRSVNCRYNEANKAEIMNSRIDAVKVLGAAISTLGQPPGLLVQVASATIYRHAEDRPQDEYTGEIENDFSVQVCKAWEKAVKKLTLPHTRTAVLRMATVLGHGGVLVPYSWLARLGIGGRHGNGKQMFSWIHIDDVQGIIEWLAAHNERQGVYNASAPNPVSNAELMKQLRSIYKMPIGINAPRWLLKTGAFIQGTEPELLLKSRWVLPARLQKEGFSFKYEHINAALNNLLA